MKGKDTLYGAIEFWNSYGFIRPDHGGNDVFFHVSEIPEGQVVKRGDRVAMRCAERRMPHQLVSTRPSTTRRRVSCDVPVVCSLAQHQVGIRRR